MRTEVSKKSECNWITQLVQKRFCSSLLKANLVKEEYMGR